VQASLVYDGGTVRIPTSMGTPLLGQMLGTELENLGEVSSRICYDSLGVDAEGKPRGRSTEKLHAHILDVINLSVYEHCEFTVRFDVGDDWLILHTFLNRKGVWLEIDDDGFEATVNFRVVLEWARHTKRANQTPYTEEVGRILYQYGRTLAPLIFHKPVHPTSLFRKTNLKQEGLNEDQAWVSLYLYGSRGFTHEMVRHRFAMSQRSTRYVDEDGSEYIEHPLITRYINDEAVDRDERHKIRGQIGNSILADRVTYKVLVAALQNYLTRQGVDKQTARKQARGASRGYLGNALASEMIYSAPVSGWLWILQNRLHPAADAEMRGVMVPALEALQASRYGSYFENLHPIPSKDGLGMVLA
jgi:thymidylate synthase ThyX